MALGMQELAGQQMGGGGFGGRSERLNRSSCPRDLAFVAMGGFSGIEKVLTLSPHLE